MAAEERPKCCPKIERASKPAIIATKSGRGKRKCTARVADLSRSVDHKPAPKANVCAANRSDSRFRLVVRTAAPYNKRPMNLFRALLTVSGFTLLSRVTGLARETLIARAFGASQFTDAFYVAFRIPNLLRRHVRGRRVLAGLRADSRRVQEPARPRRDQGARRRDVHRARLGAGVLSLVGRGGRVVASCSSVASGLAHDGQAYPLAVHDDADHVPVHHLHLADVAGVRACSIPTRTFRCPRSRRCC